MSDRDNRSRPAPAGSGTGGGGPLADSGAGAGFEAVLAAAAYDGIGALAPPAELRRLGWGRTLPRRRERWFGARGSTS
jgi:hypothetical protein